jgi:hypothetical protein
MSYNTAYYGHRVSDGIPLHTSYAWCVVFQWWCFQKAGIPTSVFPEVGQWPRRRNWFKQRALLQDTDGRRSGDLQDKPHRVRRRNCSRAAASRRSRETAVTRSGAIRTKRTTQESSYVLMEYQGDRPSHHPGGRRRRLRLCRLTRADQGAERMRLQGPRHPPVSLPGSQLKTVRSMATLARNRGGAPGRDRIDRRR